MITAAMVAENMSIKYFNTLEYVQKSEKIKDSRALAEFQVTQIEAAIETAVQYIKKDSANNVSNLRDELNGRKLTTKGSLVAVKNELNGNIMAVRTELIATKNELKQDIADLRTELKQDIADLRTELKQDITDLRTELKQDIADVRGELKDVRTELKQDFSNLRYDTIKFVVWTGVTVILTLGGLIVKGLHMI